MIPQTGILEDYIASLCIKGEWLLWDKSRAKSDFLIRKTARYLKSARTACDIGMGDGYMLECLYNMGLKVTGVDISGYIIAHLRKRFRERVTLINADIVNYKFPKDSFEIVTCLDVLEHIPDMRTVLKNLKEYMVTGGVLIGTLPLGEVLDDNMVKCPQCRHIFHRMGHCWAFDSVKQIREILEPDFLIEKISYLPYFLFRSNILNTLAYWLLRFLYRAFGLRRGRTAYFIARLYK